MRDDTAPFPLLPAHGEAMAHSHFDLDAEAPTRRLQAWRARVSHVMDVALSRDGPGRPFHAAIDRYQAGELALTDCRSDAMWLSRSLARISTDRVRDQAFHVFLEGGIDEMQGRSGSPARLRGVAGILALDMNEPVRMHRSDCRVLTLFVPTSLVQQEFAWPEALHGRALQATTPLLRLAVDHIAALAREIGTLPAEAATVAMRDSALLLIAAFGRQTRLSGSARAAARAAMFGQVRRYVQTHLHQDSLSPERVLDALQLPRATLYRMFQHEGGLGTYIRQLRLRQAAAELQGRPDLLVADIAYGAGFRSASDFTRAFRRAYDMAPLDFRSVCSRPARTTPGAARSRHAD